MNMSKFLPKNFCRFIKMQKKLIVKIEMFIIIKMLVIIKMPIKTEIIKLKL